MSGLNESADLAPATNYAFTATPVGKTRTVNINIANRGLVDAALILYAAATPASPTVAEQMEPSTTLPANGVLERTGIVLPPGFAIVANSDVANVSAQVYGFEE